MNGILSGWREAWRIKYPSVSRLQLVQVLEAGNKQQQSSQRGEKKRRSCNSKLHVENIRRNEPVSVLFDKTKSAFKLSFILFNTFSRCFNFLREAPI